MEKQSLFGMYRGIVVDNKDKEQFGRVMVYIPALMPEVDRTKGIWARPANNPIGGRNMEDDSENYYAGSSYVPKKGSWCFIFFEGGNINFPYYFGSLDLENTKVLPENQVGSNYQDKWTVIKSGNGRAIVVSDDPDDERVEITGKKRQLKTPPTGDLESVYTIDDNMTTILIDERSGKEKILIRTQKGDYLNIDVENRTLYAKFDTIEFAANKTFKLSAGEKIEIKSESDDINLEAVGDVNIKSGGDSSINAGGNGNVKAFGNNNSQSLGVTNIKAGGPVNIDGTGVNEMSGAASSASSASGASSANPTGERN